MPRCYRCQHKWRTRLPHWQQPRACPACHSPYYAKRRQDGKRGQAHPRPRTRKATLPVIESLNLCPAGLYFAPPVALN